LRKGGDNIIELEILQSKNPENTPPDSPDLLPGTRLAGIIFATPNSPNRPVVYYTAAINNIFCLTAQ